MIFPFKICCKTRLFGWNTQIKSPRPLVLWFESPRDPNSGVCAELWSETESVFAVFTVLLMQPPGAASKHPTSTTNQIILTPSSNFSIVTA